MEKIEAPKITRHDRPLDVKRGGVEANSHGRDRGRQSARLCALPDILAYLQNETELTRSTLVHILRQSGRLADVYANPQRFLDAVATDHQASNSTACWSTASSTSASWAWARMLPGR